MPLCGMKEYVYNICAWSREHDLSRGLIPSFIQYLLL